MVQLWEVMSNKTARKTKGATTYVDVLKVGKQGGGPKAFHSGALYGFKPKASVAAGKSKAAYGSHKTAAFQLHDAGPAMEFAAAPAIGLEATPQEQEAELAVRLVEEVADSSADVKVLCETYSLKREELGRLTGFSLRALAEWASGKLPSQPAKRRLREMRRLLDALAEIVKRESIPRWLHEPNRAFGGLTPLQVIELGEIDRLWAMVHDLGSGQPE
jgi:DNA-binding transcriptional regulator YiaG